MPAPSNPRSLAAAATWRHGGTGETRPVTKIRVLPEGHRGGISNTATQGVKAGNLIFVGGQMSLDEQGLALGNDIATQTRNVFESIKSVLGAAGAEMTDIVKHNVYYDCDGDDAEVERFMADMNRVRLEYFSHPGPTATELRLGLTVEDALIEVEAVAVVDTEKEPLTPTRHWNWSQPMPFCHGWKAGELIFVGAQRSLAEDGRLLGAGDIATQTANAFQHLESVLEQAGGDRRNLLRQNTYYRYFGEGTDVTDYWEKMTQVRLRHMARPSSSGTGVRIAGFPLAGELIQVEGIGVLGEEKQRLMPPNHWDWSIPENPFTQGWRVGNLVFVGGQISADAEAHAVGGDIATQTRNVLTFVRNTLAEAGADEDDVVKINSYWHGEGDWERIRETTAAVDAVLREFYPEPGPAITNLRVAGFAFEGLLIEIEAIAILDR